ncbi:3-carboxy-cis,cis-muconate cycloisomerase [Meinhardsimonia xiamenensis]|jgi:3-carboxy-cis,cis-muconate cycloisomerase|uniref:3-carboxy-cis,cis-muconate cycloisomerase n=1 Tax=Meinhardsimonia xiamenensis TaxID=990712 RepID=A0A1G9AQZ7_9RHOB|nr:adenylosuccinate lyase family protein [Meinhardsimonia xiamenensis]PRX35276.1 3-carboxy-cis,cis-muconate cycloisomerase [Meinhardsimonia xiamenensis]SDK29789.1 3-carboxy-cis,cis-muconate cycloisomerase [Meinhardsimonia xiamenensis]
MAGILYDSAIFRGLVTDAEAARLFTDSAEIRAMLVVEGALAKVQGELGLIPETSAETIHRASLEVEIDPAALAPETARSAVVVPALVAAFREAMAAPEHAQYVHWGATSQDIIDTALMLRLRQFLSLMEARLAACLKALGRLAGTHAELPMAARTYGQAATPTSFGATVAQWGRPLLRQHALLSALRADVLVVSLAGAAGTLSAMGPKGPEVRARLARALGLGDPGAPWHAERDRIARLSAWITATMGALGKMGEDLLLATQHGVGEIRLASAGGSSTMPQKQNPVLPSLLVALARHATALDATLQGAALHAQARDGSAWFCEWLALPQHCLGLARALAVAEELATTLSPDAEAMARHLDDGAGLIHAEALSFALAAHMPRPEAQAAVKRLCARVRETGTPLRRLARAEWPQIDLSAAFDPRANLGTAPQDARAFAEAVRRL